MLALVVLPGPAHAGVTYFPDASTWSTLMFEDLYPLMGDLDFNDAVIQTHWRLEDTHGALDRVVLSVNVQALGASRCNGLSLRLPLPVAQLASAHRIIGAPGGATWGPPEPLTATSSGGDVVLRLVDDLSALCDAPGFVNTDPGAPATTCAPLMFDLLLTEAAAPPAVWLAVPHDLFLTRCDDPGFEIHRPTYPGTDAFDTGLLTRGDVSPGAPFQLDGGADIPNLPFVLHVGEGTQPGDPVFAWPTERVRIDTSHPGILDFAAGSGGSTWYRTGLSEPHVFLPPTAPAVAASTKIVPCDPVSTLPNDLCGIATTGLLAWLDAHDPASWPGTGATWFDKSGNGNDASGAGHMPTPVLGAYSSYFAFTEAADARLTIDALAGYDFDEVSVEVWVNNTGGDYRAVVNTGVGIGQGWDVRFGREDYFGGANDGSALYTTGDAAMTRVTTHAPRNAWGLYGFTYDGATMRTYRDGVLFSETPVAGTVPVSPYPPTIGRYADGFAGEDLVNPLSVVRIYDRVLTPREMARHHALEAPGFTIVSDGLLLDLDARDRTSWPGSGTTWYDRTAYGHDATGAGHMPGVADDGVTPHFSFTESPDTWFSIPGLAGHDYGTDLTLEVWLKNTGGDYRAVISKGPGFEMRFGREDFHGGANNGTRLGMGPNGSLLSVNAPLGLWAQYVLTYDGTTAVAYRDGQAVASAPYALPITTSASALRIGRYEDPNEDLVNPLAVVRLYDRPLSAAEVARNFDAQRAGFGR